MKIKIQTFRFRDLTILKFLPDLLQVIACDSFGAIGPKKMDVVKIGEYELGKKIIRVPLMEVYAIGATPVVIVDNLCVEMEPTGKRIISGIKDQIRELDLNPDRCLNGSTEDNVPTIQTGAGVTVIGFLREKEFYSRKINSGDVALCVGRPKSGPKDCICLDDPEIVKFEEIRLLNESGIVHDMIPVGSKGVEHEIFEMAASRSKSFHFEDVELDIKKSAGIATCLITAIDRKDMAKFQRLVKTPSVRMGEFR